MIGGLLPAVLHAGEPATVAKEDLISAYRAYREAERMIAVIEEIMTPLDERFAEISFEDIPPNRQAEYRAAIEKLEFSVAKNPYFPEALVLLATAQLDVTQDHAKALKLYSQALEIDPKDGDVLYARACVYVLLDQPSQARKDLEGLKTLDPEYAEALLELIQDKEEELKEKAQSPAQPAPKLPAP